MKNAKITMLSPERYKEILSTISRNPEKVERIFIDKGTEENELFIKELNEISTHNGDVETITSLDDLYIIEFISFLEENFVRISDVAKFKQLILAFTDFAEGLINIAQTGKRTGVTFIDDRAIKLNLPLVEGLKKYGLDFEKATFFLNNLQQIG